MIAGVLMTTVPFSEATLAPEPTLDAFVEEAVKETLVRFGKDGLKPDQIAVTLIELDRTAQSQRTGSYLGDSPFYPASVVKLYYLVYAHQLMEDRKLRRSNELDRALTDMIVESSNDATHTVMDYVTGTTAGPELGESELQKWAERRNAVNRWYASKGYKGTNANQKTWCEGPYGRERQFLGPKFENRNSLNTNATARLMAEIALGRIVTPNRCQEMLGTLSRKVPADSKEADYQSREFIGKALPADSLHYSKAGYTSTSRHDVAYFKLPNGRELVLCVFTKNNSNQPGIIPFVAERVIARYK